MLHQLTQPAVSAGENPAIRTRNTCLRLEATTPVTVQYSRCFIAFGLFQDQLSSGIYSEYPTDGHTNLLVGKDVLKHRKTNKAYPHSDGTGPHYSGHPSFYLSTLNVTSVTD